MYKLKKIKFDKSKINFEQIIIFVLIILCIIIPLYQFLINRSLWLDETSIALNIIRRTSIHLLKPLDFYQIAPILFLQIEKFFTYIFNESEYSLRLFPLLCFYASSIFIYRISKILYRNSIVSIISFSLLIFNTTLLYYSNETKQYIVDVLFITCIYYLLLKGYKKEKTKFVLLGIVGVIGIFLSHISYIVLFCSGIFLIINNIASPFKIKAYKPIVIVIFLWFVAFAVYYYLFMWRDSTREVQTSVYFQNEFLPTNPLSIEFYKFLISTLFTIFIGLIPYGIIGFICMPILYVLGIVNLFWKQKSTLLILIILPIITHLIISALQLYPVAPRFLIYTIPCSIIGISFGLDFLLSRPKKSFTIETLRYIMISVIIILFSKVYIEIPIKRSEIKESLEYVERKIKKEDQIYINFFTSRQYTYYKESKVYSLPPNETILGSYHHYSEMESYLLEISNLHGNVWFIFSEDIWYEKNDKNFLTTTFNKKGYSVLDEFNTIGSSAIKYYIP